MSGCQRVEGSHDGGLVSQRDRDLWCTMGTLERDRTNIAYAGCSRAKLHGNHSQSHHLGPYRSDVPTLILFNGQHRFPTHTRSIQGSPSILDEIDVHCSNRNKHRHHGYE
eukprot:GHVU01143527.1.p2 GENE.GHVU01143527.1~~GHVU01143527.1.p2  ORF type:complete len:110 (-),score=2.10 GHVU01143527.1:217-546(-)